MTDRGASLPSGPPDRPPDALYARIRAAVDATPASTTSTRVRVAAALAALPCIAVVVLAFASGVVYDRPALRIDLASPLSSPLLVALLLIVALTLAVTLAATAQGRLGLGSRAGTLLTAAALVAPVYAAVVFGAPSDATVAALDTADRSPWGLRCLTIAAAVGALVTVSFVIALRRSVPVASRLRGGALGAAAGAWSGLTVFLFCPAIEPAHLWIGHVLPIAVFTLFGVAVLPRALRP